MTFRTLTIARPAQPDCVGELRRSAAAAVDADNIDDVEMIGNDPILKNSEYF